MKKLSLFLSMVVMASVKAVPVATYSQYGDVSTQGIEFFVVQTQATRDGGQGLAKFEEAHPNALFVANLQGLSNGSNKMGAVNSKLFVVLSDSAPSNSSSSELEIELNNLKQDFAQLLEVLARKDQSVRNLAIGSGFSTGGQVRAKYAIG